MVVDEARDLHGTTHEIMARSLAMLGTHDGVTADDLDGGKDEHTFAGYHSQRSGHERVLACLLYTSDAADDLPCVALGGRRILKKTICSIKKRKQE